MEKEPLYWFTTVSGVHVPVFEGETKQKALKRKLNEIKSKDKNQVEKIQEFKDKKGSNDRKQIPLDKYRDEIDKTDLKDLDNLDYQKMYDDYEKWYKSLNKKEVSELLEKTQEHYGNIDTKDSNPLGEYLNKKLEYDKLPEMINKSDFFIDEFGDKTSDTTLLDENHWYRGIDGKNSKKYIEDFKKGKYFAGEGYGMNGTYFSQSYSEAMAYTHDNKENIIYAIPKKSAKIANNQKINIIKRNIVSKLDWNKYMSEDGELYTNFTDFIFNDNGYTASLLGYDIIKVEEDNRRVVLNRNSIKVVR